MGGKVPHNEMTDERRKLLERAADADQRMSKSHLLTLVGLLAGAAEDCPRVGCATCSFMSKHEAATVPQDPRT